MLTGDDKEEILLLLKSAKDARVIYRANALNLRDKGYTLAETADILEITSRTVLNIQQNYEEHGLPCALNDDPRPGQPPKFDDRIKSRIVALVCSDPPEGFDRWSLSLIQEKTVNQRIVDEIGRESIRLILKEHDLKPWQQKSWCVPELDEEFIQRMEDILNVYEAPCNAQNPLICLDEKPIQLIDHVRPASGLLPGSPEKIDFEYQRKGTANVFCAVEPKAGVYISKVTERRTARDFAKFLSSLERKYSQAEKIVLVMDNLNTHKKKSLVDFYGKEKGEWIWSRFDVHYTPKHGSWLNQAEIAINMFSRQCLGKSRIQDIENLRKRTAAWIRYINGHCVTIKWKFTVSDSREKFGYG